MEQIHTATGTMIVYPKGLNDEEKLELNEYIKREEELDAEEDAKYLERGLPSAKEQGRAKIVSVMGESGGRLFDSKPWIRKKIELNRKQLKPTPTSEKKVETEEETEEEMVRRMVNSSRALFNQRLADEGIKPQPLVSADSITSPEIACQPTVCESAPLSSESDSAVKFTGFAKIDYSYDPLEFQTQPPVSVRISIVNGKISYR